MAPWVSAAHLLTITTALWASSAGDAGAEKAEKEIVACMHKQTIDFLLREKAKKGEEHFKGLVLIASTNNNCITVPPAEKYTIIQKDQGDGFVLILDCCTGQYRWTRTEFIK